MTPTNRLCSGIWKSSEKSNPGAGFDGSSVNWESEKMQDHTVSRFRARSSKRHTTFGTDLLWLGFHTPGATLAWAWLHESKSSFPTLESPPLFPARVLGMEALWQRDTLDQTVLRQQHPFVFEAGDARGVRCKSEEHSSWDGPFKCVLLSIAFSPSSAFCVSTVRDSPHTQIRCIPCSPSLTSDSRIFISAPKKEQSLWSSLLLAVPKQHRGNVMQSSQPAVCRGRAKERAAKP